MTRLASSFTCHCLRISALGCALFLIAQLGYSQPATPSKVGTGPDELKAPKNWDREGRDERTQFEALQKGDRPVATDEDKAILDDAAKWYAYRLTQPQYQEPDTTGKAMHDLVKQAEGKIVDARDPRRPPHPN